MVIPKKYKPYKLVTISGINEEINITSPILFVCMKYQYSNGYIKLFETLKELYNFNPVILHTDFEASTENAILNGNIFNKKPILIKCNFHFSKAIIAKMKKCGMCKKKLSKINLELLRNIQMLCYLDKNIIKDYIKFLNNEFDKKKYITYNTTPTSPSKNIILNINISNIKIKYYLLNYLSILYNLYKIYNE